VKIKKVTFVRDPVRVGNRITGTADLPPHSRIIHCGASPPEGNLCLWAEVPSIEVPDTAMEKISIIILRHDDEVPQDCEYRGYILANPILLVYEHVPSGVKEKS